MEIVENLIPETYLFALGWMIIHAFWQIASIGLLLWLGLRVFNQKSAAFKYRLSSAAIAIIALLAVMTFSWHLDTNPTSKLSLISKADWAYLSAQSDVIQQIQAPNEGRADWLLVSKRIEKYIPALVNIWMMGAFLFFFKTASSLADLRSLHRKNHEIIPEDLARFVNRISKQLAFSKSIKVLSSKFVEVPLTYGILKPVILIPSALLFHMSPGQLEAIITHEMAHIKRHDYLVNLIQSILEILFFFHPVFWWINHEIKKQREMACDEMAMALGANPKDLAYGLANVINHAQNHAPEMAMAAAKKPNPTLDRIKKIMGVKTSPTQPTTLTTITMIITLILGATLIVGAYDQQNIPENEDYLTVESNTKTLDFRFDLNSPNSLEDTVPPKTNLPKNQAPILESPLSPEQMESLLKHMEPLKEMGMLFKELEFNWGDFSNMPHLELKDLPMPNFNLENMPKWDLDPEIFQGMLPDSKMLKELATIRPPMPDSLLFFKGNFAKRNDMNSEEWQQHLREQNEKLAKWKEEHADKLEAWNQERIAKTEEWEKSIEPKIQDYQAKIKGWEKENQPKMEEYQARVKAWEQENQPRIEAFQKKMEEWQKANEEKLKEFQQKMLEWQKEHEAELQELQKRIRETNKEN
jgi:bla regulator protein blaR1